MALTRNFLKSMGLTDEQVNAIIENHVETVDGLKAERDSYKAKAETVATLTQERDDWKAKYESAGDAVQIQADFDAYKQQVETDKANTAKTAALRKALKAAGVQRDEFTELLLGKVDLAAIQLDGDTVKEPEKLIDPLRTAYGGCFATKQQQGTPPNNPPTGGGGTGKTKEQILAIKDPAIRQAEMAKNLSLFGIE